MVEGIALLTTAALFGGMILYSFGFAPMVFSQLNGEQAGTMLRNAFPWYYLFIIATSALAAALVFLTGDAVALVLLLTTLLIAVFARQGLMPMINTTRDKQMAGDAKAKSRFNALHGASVALNFVQLGAIGWALVRFL
ncbi:MAG: DUF4149 domain-containing protein [Pseudomonadota bacterium]